MNFIKNDDPSTVGGPAMLRAAFPNTSNPELLDAAVLATEGFRAVTLVRPDLDPGQSYGPPELDGDVVTYPVASAIPRQVTRRQARRALLAAGLLEAVDAHVATMGPEAVIDWQDATIIERASPFVAGAATALGLTDAEIDGLFVAAAVIA